MKSGPTGQRRTRLVKSGPYGQNRLNWSKAGPTDHTRSKRTRPVKSQPNRSKTGPAGQNRLTGSPGSDWIRAHGLGIALAFGLLLLGLVLVLGGRSGRKRTTGPKVPGGLGPGSTGGPSSTTTTP